MPGGRRPPAFARATANLGAIIDLRIQPAPGANNGFVCLGNRGIGGGQIEVAVNCLMHHLVKLRLRRKSTTNRR